MALPLRTKSRLGQAGEGLLRFTQRDTTEQQWQEDHHADQCIAEEGNGLDVAVNQPREGQCVALRRRPKAQTPKLDTTKNRIAEPSPTLAILDQERWLRSRRPEAATKSTER